MTELDNVGFCVCLNVLMANNGGDMGIFGWIKLKVLGRGVSAPAALTEDEVRTRARNGTQLEVEAMLSQHPQWANTVLDIAIKNDRWPLISIAKKSGVVIDCPSVLYRVMQRGDVHTSISLVENGAPLPLNNIESAIADAHRHRRAGAGPFRQLLKTIFDRHGVNSVDYVRLVSEWGNQRGLRDMGALLHEFGYDFHKTRSINVVGFFHRSILGSYEGELCDLLTWGQKIDFEHPHFDDPPEDHKLNKLVIINDKEKAELMIAEQTAASINQALADAGLTQDDTPKPKRKM
ncbi:TPA: hypothetical protein UOJ36_000026 [Stenotrophomonas maltophilia]|nr:hypothetical protein [Stenotrophomonas maltophilia]HEL5350101.1 hypothetical protein [Stenotrophomonas maltophilia]HEL5589143.1 hypothetical protein [Stenotrophomonas maltophilia]HEL5627238.1 hypothetical protein [Stenotrophomonas maltophilia]